MWILPTVFGKLAGNWFNCSWVLCLADFFFLFWRAFGQIGEAPQGGVYFTSLILHEPRCELDAAVGGLWTFSRTPPQYTVLKKKCYGELISPSHFVDQSHNAPPWADFNVSDGVCDTEVLPPHVGYVGANTGAPAVWQLMTGAEAENAAVVVLVRHAPHQ